LKLHQRLDTTRLSEVLAERGLCEPQALREALQLSGRGHPGFAEAVVSANLIGDWELSKVVAEIYNLPFLPLDLVTPDERALNGLDLAYLAEHGLVPMGRFGSVLTVAMPGMVSAEVLAGITIADVELAIVPVVGSAVSNRRWIAEKLQPKLAASIAAPIANAAAALSNPEWGSIFDQADAAVLLDLQGGQPDHGAV